MANCGHLLSVERLGAHFTGDWVDIGPVLNESDKPISQNVAFRYADYITAVPRFCTYENSIV